MRSSLPADRREALIADLKNNYPGYVPGARHITMVQEPGRIGELLLEALSVPAPG